MTFNYKDQNDDFWKKHLNNNAYDVCHLKGTEPRGSGKYDKFYEKGTYYCAGCGGDFPLYNSESKFDSGTGWPSFFEALPLSVEEKPDHTGRKEVTCARCGSHLGHVFDDGPNPTGKRYCMNSVALKFTPENQEPTRTYTVTEEALFAMGCFWCAAASFFASDGINLKPGILSVKSGYAGGELKNPTYENHEGYREAVQVIFDPDKISYEELLVLFWQNIDPLDMGGQFHDRGFSYTPAVYTKSNEQKLLAEASKIRLEKRFKRDLSIPIIPATTFFDAEEYHQNYHIKNKERYQSYHKHSGRP